MKKIILWVSSATLLAMILCAAFFIGGCSKANPEVPSENELIGAWMTEMLGDTGEDILTVTMEFKSNSRMTVTTESDLDDEPSSTDMYWSIDGDKLMIAYVDEDEDGTADPIDKVDWEEYTCSLSGQVLTLSDEWGINVWKYNKI